MERNLLSCDPGLKGAFVLWKDGRPVGYTLMPTTYDKKKRREVLDFYEILDVLEEYKKEADTFALEKTMGISGQGAAAAYSFGHGRGFLLGAALALGFAVIEVSPTRWSLDFHAGLKKATKPKDRSRQAVEKYFPGFDVLPGRCRVPHDGICDALGIGFSVLKRGEMK